LDADDCASVLALGGLQPVLGCASSLARNAFWYESALGRALLAGGDQNLVAAPATSAHWTPDWMRVNKVCPAAGAGRAIISALELNRISGSPPMTDDIDAAAVSLAKEADARRAELERGRQVPPDLFRRAAEAGLFRQLICAELGGPGRSAVEWFRTGVEMARWEPSFSWVVTQAAGDHATFAACGDPAFTSVFLADPNACVSGSANGAGTLVPEDDGYRLEGRWGYCSGCQGATWAGGVATLPLTQGQEKPDALYALVPIERARIEETWDVMGMIGTGSHTVVIEPQHIPAAWAFRITRLGPRDYGPMSVAAGNSNWPIATSVAAVMLGTSRRALDAATDLVREKRDRATKSPLIGNAHVQRQLMSAEGAWSAGNAGVEQALIRMWEDAGQSRRLPIATRIALLTANVHASATSIEIIESVCDIIGTSIAPAGAIFGACLRDARTLGSHTAVVGGTLELAAQMRFGLLEDNFLV
jgi:alkylation response protein AidB-like acyl-CoA dehydrogenase